MVDPTLEESILTQIKAGLSVVACVAGWQPSTSVAYVSTPITTGKRMYDLFEQRGITAREQLPSSEFKEKVMGPNIVSGDQFGRELRATGRYGVVICPATFFAKGWTQEHYMALWERTIDTFSTAVHFNEGWEYSTGCVEELLIAFTTGKKIYEGMNHIPFESGVAIERVEKAIRHIQRIGSDTTKLRTLSLRLSLGEFTRREVAAERVPSVL